MQDLTIQSLEINELNVELTDNFTISRGSVKEVRNLLVTLILQDGTKGYGEIAPFEELAGDDRQTCLNTFHGIKDQFARKSLKNIRQHSHLLMEAIPDNPAVRCGLEMAMLDALSRKLDIPLWSYLGGYGKNSLVTDVTIPILSKERSMELAGQWHEKGFRTLKIKVGSDYRSEVELITSMADKYPDLRFIIDANQGFEEEEALAFIRELIHRKCDVILYEQPVNRYDIDAMARLTSLLQIPVAADETVFSIKDLTRVIRHKAANVINLKIMKTGIFQTMQIATTARSFGLELMIGGMVETRLAMGSSVALAMGFVPVRYIDLDTPLLMRSDPFLGGYSYCGPEIRSWDSPGLGMVPIS